MTFKDSMHRSELERHFGRILTTRRHASSDAADEEILHNKSHASCLSKNKYKNKQLRIETDIVLLSKSGKSGLFEHFIRREL